MKLLRSGFLATLLALSVPSPLSTAFALEPATAGSAEEIRNLRQEIDTLRRRIAALEQQRGARESIAADVQDKGRLEAELQAILDRYQREKSAIWRQAHGKIREHRGEVIKALTAMQEAYTRNSKLDEAVAIRDAIRNLHEAGRKVLPDPGTLTTSITTPQVYYFRVKGAASGTLYGTDIYTSDSLIAAAAVHAGILKVGESGIVKITTIPTHQGYVSSTRHGITSSGWSSYPGYKIEALGDEDQDLLERQPEPSGAKPPTGFATPKPVPEIEDPFSITAPPSGGTSTAQVSSAIPAEAREQVEGFINVSTEIRKATGEKVARLSRETVERLTPIQDAHTRAARLDDAIAVRELIRKISVSGGN